MIEGNTAIWRASTGAAITVALMATLAAAPVRAADQITIVDYWFVNAGGHISNYKTGVLPGLPPNFLSPIDYYTLGKVYTRLEVVKKSSTKAVNWHSYFVCNIGTYLREANTSSKDYATPGVYTWSTNMRDLWHHTGETCDWSHGVETVKACEDFPEKNPTAEQYAADYPQTVRFTLTVVPAGATYIPPAQMAPPAKSGMVGHTVLVEPGHADGGTQARDAGAEADGSRGIDAAAPQPDAALVDAASASPPDSGSAIDTRAEPAPMPRSVDAIMDDPGTDLPPADHPAPGACAVAHGAAGPGSAAWLFAAATYWRAWRRRKAATVRDR